MAHPGQAPAVQGPAVQSGRQGECPQASWRECSARSGPLPCCFRVWPDPAPVTASLWDPDVHCRRQQRGKQRRRPQGALSCRPRPPLAWSPWEEGGTPVLAFCTFGGIVPSAWLILGPLGFLGTPHAVSIPQAKTSSHRTPLRPCFPPAGPAPSHVHRVAAVTELVWDPCGQQWPVPLWVRSAVGSGLGAFLRPREPASLPMAFVLQQQRVGVPTGPQWVWPHLEEPLLEGPALGWAVPSQPLQPGTLSSATGREPALTNADGGHSFPPCRS